MSDNNKNDRRSPAPDLEALTKAYEQSLNGKTTDVKQIPAAEVKSSAAGAKKGFVPEDYSPRNEATPEHDKIVDKIREDRRKRSHSVWTDTPVLKPKKSVWIDDGTAEIDAAAVRQAARNSSAAKPQPSAQRRTDKDIVTPLPLMTEQPKETAQPIKPVQSDERDGGSVVPLLSEKPRKQELVINVGVEGDTRVRRLPQRVNKQKITVDMSGYRERSEREESPNRRTVSLNMPISKMQPDEPEPPVEEQPEVVAEERAASEETPEKAPAEEEISSKRTVSLKMPISKINLDDLEPVIKENKPEEKPETVSEEEAPDEEMSEENADDEDIVEESGEDIVPAEEIAEEEVEEEDEEEVPAAGEYNFSAMIKKVRAEKTGKVREEYDQGGVSEHTLITERAQRHGVEQQYIMPPRHLTKHKKPITHELEFQFINCIMCVGVVFTIFFSLLFMERESGFIASENRELAEFPEFSSSDYFSGKYTKGIDDYFTDTISGREELKKFGAFYDRIKGIGSPISDTQNSAESETPDEGKTADVTADSNSDSNTATDADKEDTPTLSDDVIVFGDGKDVRAVVGYYGQPDVTAEYARTIGKYKEEMPDVKVYSMTVPTASAYYLPDDLKDIAADQKDSIGSISSELKDIISVDVYDAIGGHADEYIYSRTDHRWQPLAAYYAGKVFADAAGVDYPELDTYEECRIKDFVCTMYADSGYDSRLLAAPDTFIYYKPDNEYTTAYYEPDFTGGEESSLFFDDAEGANCYAAILGRDDLIAEIDTDVGNGRTLVIFKDSFGNALAPFLTHSFEKIYVCDIGSFDENAVAFCRNVGCTDLLFAMSVTSCSTETDVEAINNNRIRESAMEKANGEADESGKADSTGESSSETADSRSDESIIPEYDDSELGG